MSGSLRLPAVSGRFYPGTAHELERELSGYLVTEGEPLEARGIIVPHAGYIYSGRNAGTTFAQVIVPACAVVL